MFDDAKPRRKRASFTIMWATVILFAVSCANSLRYSGITEVELHRRGNMCG